MRANSEIWGPMRTDGVESFIGSPAYVSCRVECVDLDVVDGRRDVRPVEGTAGHGLGG